VDVDTAGFGRLHAAVESRNQWPAHTSGVTGDVGGCVPLCVGQRSWGFEKAISELIDVCQCRVRLLCVGSRHSVRVVRGVLRKAVSAGMSAMRTRRDSLGTSARYSTGLTFVRAQQPSNVEAIAVRSLPASLIVREVLSVRSATPGRRTSQSVMGGARRRISRLLEGGGRRLRERESEDVAVSAQTLEGPGEFKGTGADVAARRDDAEQPWSPRIRVPATESPNNGVFSKGVARGAEGFWGCSWVCTWLPALSFTRTQLAQLTSPAPARPRASSLRPGSSANRSAEAGKGVPHLRGREVWLRGSR